MNNVFYIYLIYDPTIRNKYCYPELGISFLYEPIYIGKGSSHRIKHHFRNCNLKKNSLKNNRIKEIKEKTGLNNFYTIIKENLTETEAYKLEKIFIEVIGRKRLNTGPLLNFSKGGVLGGFYSGENSGSSKFTNITIKEIRDKFNSNKYKFIDLAKEYKVTAFCIKNIIYNITYIDKNYEPPEIINRGSSKFTKYEIKIIRNEFDNNMNTIYSLSLKYNVTKMAMYRIIMNKTYYDKNYIPPNICNKLTDKDATNIRKLYSNGLSVKQIMKIYNVKHKAVYEIINNNTHII